MMELPFACFRKTIFEREDPPFYWAVMDEAALRRPFGGKECMKAQLQYVLETATLPRVTVQALPFAQGAHSMAGGSLVLLTLKNGSTVTLVESFATGGSSRGSQAHPGVDPPI